MKDTEDDTALHAVPHVAITLQQRDTNHSRRTIEAKSWHQPETINSGIAPPFQGVGQYHKYEEISTQRGKMNRKRGKQIVIHGKQKNKRLAPRSGRNPRQWSAATFPAKFHARAKLQHRFWRRPAPKRLTQHFRNRALQESIILLHEVRREVPTLLLKQRTATRHADFRAVSQNCRNLSTSQTELKPMLRRIVSARHSNTYKRNRRA